MFRSIRNRITLISSAIVLTTGSLVAFAGGQASAAFTAQLCVNNGTTNACMNAWNGGPFVTVYTGMGAVPHDEFSIGTLSNGNTYLKYVGGGAWSGHCVGDAYNDPGYVTTSLDPCPTNTDSGGWGTNFTQQSCGGSSVEGIALKNIHHNGWLYPSGFANQDEFYLNHGTKYCFGFYDPADKG